MITLHGYWRSTASYRVRIALGLKSIDFRHVTHDLRTGEHKQDGYLALSPQGLVPTLEEDGAVISQSLAIMEWLEERWPRRPLLPRDPDDRAMVRSMAQIIACDIHPLNNLRVLTALEDAFGADEAQVQRWIAAWIRQGFDALDVLVRRHGGLYAFGDEPSLADCCLIPQIYAANRFNVPLDDYPRLVQISERAMLLEAFSRAVPERQPDAPREVRRPGRRPN